MYLISLNSENLNIQYHELTRNMNMIVRIYDSQVKQYLVAENISELMELMTDCNELSLWLNLYNIDPLLPGEIALKSALLLEAHAKNMKTSLFGNRTVRLRIYILLNRYN